jgi:alkylation response protein AidB-like acyl-CoA dehydrogenase
VIAFELNEQQELYRKKAHDFAARELRPVAVQCDLEARFPPDLIRKGHQAGLITFRYPEEYGGAGVDDQITWAVVREELAWGCPALTVGMLASNLAATPILHMGSPQQKQKYLTRLCDPGRVAVAAMAMTEPDAGSDVSSIATTARKVNGRYVLNGRKVFITNGGIADVTVVYGRMEGTEGMNGMTAFILDGQPEGLSMGRKEEKMGIKASHTAEIVLDDVEVSEEDRLGPEGQAFLMSMRMFDESRIMVAALAVGIARGAMEIALQHLAGASQFGKNMNARQSASYRLSDMAVRIDAARLLAWRAAWLANQGKRMTRESAMAKCFASETANWVTDEAVDILGLEGCLNRSLVEKMYRDARVWRIFEGTSEIMRAVTARELFKAQKAAKETPKVG